MINNNRVLYLMRYFLNCFVLMVFTEWVNSAYNIDFLELEELSDKVRQDIEDQQHYTAELRAVHCALQSWVDGARLENGEGKCCLYTVFQQAQTTLQTVSQFSRTGPHRIRMHSHPPDGNFPLQEYILSLEIRSNHNHVLLFANNQHILWYNSHTFDWLQLKC